MKHNAKHLLPKLEGLLLFADPGVIEAKGPLQMAPQGDFSRGNTRPIQASLSRHS